MVSYVVKNASRLIPVAFHTCQERKAFFDLDWLYCTFERGERSSGFSENEGPKFAALNQRKALPLLKLERTASNTIVKLHRTSIPPDGKIIAPYLQEERPMKNRDTHNRLTVDQITAFEEYLRTEEREQTTIKKYLRNIRVFVVWLDGASVTKSAVIAWKEHLLAKQYAPRHG